jgi:hypothetical protein
MSQQCRVSIVIGERPSQAPEGWVIYNAPRPIFGGIEWRGEFAHGVFYAAIDPVDTSPRSAWMREENRKQDATILIYRTEAYLYREGVARLLAEHGDADERAIITDESNRSWVVDNQMDYEQGDLEGWQAAL